MTLRRAGVLEAPVFAALHASSFAASWTADAFAALLAQPGVIGWLWGDPPTGLLLARAAADEAEILTIAVEPAARRRSGGALLVEEMLRILSAGQTRRVFLEVAADNTAALALYRAKGFVPCGRRAGYYAGGVDAVIMERKI
jgi:ribosomal-protein-alanine N-acetyltransferase